jgi:hypothetical protein
MVTVAIIVNMLVITGLLMPVKLGTISETVEKGRINHYRLPIEAFNQKNSSQLCCGVAVFVI